MTRKRSVLTMHLVLATAFLFLTSANSEAVPYRFAASGTFDVRSPYYYETQLALGDWSIAFTFDSSALQGGVDRTFHLNEVESLSLTTPNFASGTPYFGEAYIQGGDDGGPLRFFYFDITHSVADNYDAIKFRGQADSENHSAFVWEQRCNLEGCQFSNFAVSSMLHDDHFVAYPVPEPGSIALAGIGLLALALARVARRRVFLATVIALGLTASARADIFRWDRPVGFGSRADSSHPHIPTNDLEF